MNSNRVNRQIEQALELKKYLTDAQKAQLWSVQELLDQEKEPTEKQTKMVYAIWRDVLNKATTGNIPTPTQAEAPTAPTADLDIPFSAPSSPSSPIDLLNTSLLAKR